MRQELSLLLSCQQTQPGRRRIFRSQLAQPFAQSKSKTCNATLHSKTPRRLFCSWHERGETCALKLRPCSVRVNSLTCQKFFSDRQTSIPMFPCRIRKEILERSRGNFDWGEELMRKRSRSPVSLGFDATQRM